MACSVCCRGSTVRGLLGAAETGRRAACDLARRQHLDPCRGQLNRQRQAIEAAADLLDGCTVVRCHGEAGTDGGGALGEQPHRGGFVERGDGHAISPGTASGSWLVANTRRRGIRRRAGDQRRRGIEDVLAVVEHQQGARYEAPDEQRGGVPHPRPTHVDQPERVDSGPRHTLVAPRARPRPARPATPGHGTTVGHAAPPRRRGGSCPSRRTNQADHAMIGDEPQARELAVAANEAGGWVGSAGRRHGSRPPDREPLRSQSRIAR